MGRILRMRELFAARCAALEQPFRRTAPCAGVGSIPQMGIELTSGRVPKSVGASGLFGSRLVAK
jgi:hypothetical protein